MYGLDVRRTLAEERKISHRWGHGSRTAVTAGGKWTAQCEHTLLITDDGVEILTASPLKKTERFPAKQATAA